MTVFTPNAKVVILKRQHFSLTKVILWPTLTKLGQQRFYKAMHRISVMLYRGTILTSIHYVLNRTPKISEKGFHYVLSEGEGIKQTATYKNLLIKRNGTKNERVSPLVFSYPICQIKLDIFMLVRKTW